MFLKSLTLKGFKSFAEPATLELEPGITVVVGPNGSGKSNVVDAVAWVLGAQGPRTVRSSKMEDVIFAGSQRRPALGRAEVALTIDNSSGRLPIGLAEVTITRTLWRSGESEYSINGAPCRLLDVEELLSDSGVGRRQHVIVSQGQLDAVLNARPEDRRLIVEEAAGVLKYRRRRERAERRLAGTEGDLARLQDLLREVRRQIRPLERQAEAARRRESLEAEHRALRLHLAGRELAEAAARAEDAQRRGAELEAAAAGMRERLAAVVGEISAAEEAVAANSMDELNLAVGRLEGLSERSRGLAALLAERRRSVEAATAAVVDAAVVASLEAEAASVAGELGEAEACAGGLALEREALQGDEESFGAERAAAEAALSGEGEVAAGSVPQGGTEPAAELRGRLGVLRRSLERGREELSRADSAAAAVAARVEELGAEVGRRRAEMGEAESAEAPIVAALEHAEGARREAEGTSEAAASEVSSLEAERRSQMARAEALAMALDEVRARGGAHHLGGAPGLLGTLAELVEVDPGWEKAFEAAAGEAVASVVMRGVAEAVAAMEQLSAGGVSATLLAAPADAHPAGAPAWQAVTGQGALLAHVRAPHPAVSGLLGALLGRVAVVEGDWRAALDLALEHPGTTVVTLAGDRFGPEGWRIGDPGPGATGAALAEAEARAQAAGEALAAAGGRRQAAARALAAARAAEAEASATLDDNDSRMGAAADALQRAEAERARAREEAGELAERREQLARRVAEEEAEVAELERLLPLAEEAEEAATSRARRAREVREDLERRAAALAARRHDLQVRAAGLDERRAILARRSAEIEERLARSVRARRDAAQRRETLERAALATSRLAGVVAACTGRLDAEVAALGERRRLRLAALEEARRSLVALRGERGDLEGRLVEAAERFQQAEVERMELRLRREAAVETLRRELGVEPEAALDAPAPPLREGVTTRQRAGQLERELTQLGPVNPLAVAELEALEERSRFVEGQLDDVRSARRELAKVIRAIDAEIVGVFSAAYADVSRHFSDLVATLFPGGAGSLSLTDPSDPLETGIEVSARPAGKQVRKLSLLSGGERSLVALAFLFAVFRSRPSPFYLMDEVEAALDDVNLHRFLNLINEFRAEAQLVIVSHQKRTMEVADCLYGVTMMEGGSSKVVSERAPARA